MSKHASVNRIERFRLEASNQLLPQLQEVEPTAQRLRYIRELALRAERCIHLDWGLDLPHPEVSGELIDIATQQCAAVEAIRPKIQLDESWGCWTLPLNEEYDQKGRARYPTLSIAAFDARGELAHRYVVRRLIGRLQTSEHLDHVCRRHACCNPAHLEAVDQSTNTRRGLAARRHTTGQERLF